MRHSWAFGALKEIAIRLLELTNVELTFHWHIFHGQGWIKCHAPRGGPKFEKKMAFGGPLIRMTTEKNFFLQKMKN